MLNVKRRSLSEINLNIENNDCIKIHNVNGNEKDDKPMQQNPLELTASTALFKRIESSIKIAAKNEAYSNGTCISNSSTNIRYHQQIKRKKFIKLKKIKCEIYNLLERPSGSFAFIYRLFTFTLILIPILFNTFTTIKTIKEMATKSLFYIEFFVTFYFFIEYCLRIWSSGYRATYLGFTGKIKFMSRPIMIIELTIFLSGSSILFVNFMQNYHDNKISSKDYQITSTILIILRFLQLFRLLYVDRKAQTWSLLLDVVNKHKFELTSSIYIGFIILLLSSYLIFICEHAHNDSFHTYSDALYWSIITMTTIGYGDISPKTYYGKIIATGLCILGVAFWTLPSGIIGSGFALKVEQKNKRDQFNRLVPAAASLIQNWWRMKVIYEIPPSNPSKLFCLLKIFGTNKQSNHTTTQPPKESKKKSIFNNFTENNKKNLENVTQNQNRHRRVEFDETDILNFRIDYYNERNEKEKLINRSKSFEEKQMKILKKIKPETLIILRIILALKFFVAKRKFKSAHKPYDFKDVIEQYTQGNMDIVIKIKELQRKLDQSLQIQRNSVNVKIPSPKNNHQTLEKNKSIDKENNDDKENNNILELQTHVKKLDYRINLLDEKIDKILKVINKE